MDKLQNKVAIVTGASRGIGRAIALRLAANNFSIVLNYAHNHQAANKVVNQIKDQGGSVVAVQADISKPEEVENLFTQATKTFGGIDVLVNNAGTIDIDNRSLAETDNALFDRIFAVNAKGPFMAMREAAKRLRPGGRVINLSSSLVGMNLPGYAVYTATKAALEAMTAIFAKELRGKDITVNSVGPGPTATDLFFEGKSKEIIEHYAKAAPIERLGTPEDIAEVVAFLASPVGGWINGQTVRASGGLV
jgi:3-oxoacyl-[acyl-carrier protein] reductase